MAAEPKKTGIKNADDLLTLALAFELDVTVTTETTGPAVTHAIRITIPVPPVHAGTDEGRAIAAHALTMTWSKRTTPRARGFLVNATMESPDSNHKVRTLSALETAVRDLGHEAARLARETGARPEGVVNSPHTLYFGGEPRHADIPVAQIRRIVANRRNSGRPVNQHPETGAIHIGNHSYRPQTAPVADNRKHVRTVNAGTPELIPTRDALAEINHAMLDGKRDVREMSAARSSARIVYRDERGTVDLRPATDAERDAAELLGEGDRWVKHFRVFGRQPQAEPVDRASALDTIAWARGDGWQCYRAEAGGVNLESTTGESSYWLEPVTEAAPTAEEERAAEADRIRTATAREAYAFRVRLEAQQLATNQVIAERAAVILIAAGHTEATAEGREGFSFSADHLAVRLRSECPNGPNWADAMDEYEEALDAAEWYAQPNNSVRFGAHLAITPPYALAKEMVMEGQGRSVAAAHEQALAENAQR